MRRDYNQPHAIFGFLPERSYADIAVELGVTRARVQQIEAKALEKVRRALAARFNILSVDDILPDDMEQDVEQLP